MSESTFRVKIIVDTKDQTSKPAKKASTAMDQLKSAAKLAAGAYVAFRAAQKAVEFVKFGAQVQATRNRFIKFAGGTKQAAEFLEVFQTATDGAVDKMGSMESGARLLQMGLVDSVDEMGIMAASAVKLGDQTISASKRLGDFAALLANKAIPRLDNFGIASGKVREEVNRLKAAGVGADEAFKMAVLKEAQISLAILGDTSQLTATKIAIMESGLKDAQTAIASTFATIADDSGALDKIIEFTGDLADAAERIEESGFFIKQATADINSEAARQFPEYRKQVVAIAEAQEKAAISADGWQKDEDELRASLEEAKRAIQESDQATIDLGVGTGDFFDVMSEGQSDLAMYEGALGDVTDAMLDQEAAVVATARANREAAADFTSLGRDAVKMAEEFTKDREGIEAEHQENLATIAKKGQSTAIRFDEAAETERLSRLKERLIVSLAQQADFNDKTKDAQRLSKEFSIANLQEEIAAKEQRLEDFHAGRLVKAGINTAGLVAEEQARFDQELAILDESRIEQERIQRESLGRMLLEHVVTWGQMAGATATEIEAMQLKIAEEYGIITEDGAAAATAQKDTWLENFALIKQVGVEAFTAIENRINLIPKTITVDIVFQERQAAKAAAEAVHGSAVPGMASGGFVAGGAIDVGEEGPERVILPAGSFVNNAAQTSSITNFNQTVNTRATKSNVMADFEMMRALAN